MRRSPTSSPCHPSWLAGAALLAVAVAVATTAGCAEPAGGVVILQNQKAALGMSGTTCEVSAEATDPQLTGKFDVALDRPYPYFVYPLVENRLPSITTLGGVERNSITVTALRIAIRAPAGVDPRWQAGCPATFDTPVSAVLNPAELRSLVAEGMRACHVQRLRELIAERAIPGDTAQPVFFTLELRVVADRSGSELESPTFPFPVQVCAGCQQVGYPDTPTCATAPKPNPFTGNPCNIAQDSGQVLCCVDDGGAVVCPAPSM